MQGHTNCQLCIEYRASAKRMLLAVNHPKEKRSKKEKKRRTEEDSVARARKAFERQLVPINNAKTKFTDRKTRLNILLRLGRDARDDETRLLYEETRGLYQQVILLYKELLAQMQTQQVALRETRDEIQGRYEEAKRALIEVREQRQRQDIEGASIGERYQNNRPHCQEPVREEGKKRLSKTERSEIKELASFYKELYEDAVADREEESRLKKAEKTHKTQMNKLHAQREVLDKELAFLAKEDKHIRKLLSNFTTRNAYLNQELACGVSMEEIEESEPGQCILVEQEEEEEDDEDYYGDQGMLSETSESDQLVSQLMEVRGKLIDGDFTSLMEEFNEDYHDYFLGPLIAMYRAGNEKLIVGTARTLIALLVDPRARVITELYDRLVRSSVEDEYDDQEILSYVESVEPPLMIRNLQRKLTALRAKVHSLGRVELFKAINAFVYEEEGQEEEKEEASAPGRALWVSDSFIDERKEKFEELKAQTLFSAYKVLNIERAPQRHACLYTALETESDRKVAIRIVPRREEERSEREAMIYELLASVQGFVRLIELFRLETFPKSLFTPCSQLKGEDLYRPVDVYVTEYSAFEFHVATGRFDEHEKFCALFELLSGLRVAKAQYGIQHNDIELGNLRFKEATEEPPRRYRLAEDEDVVVECYSRYMVTLGNFGMASMDSQMSQEERALLSGLDYASFSRLATLPELHFSDRIEERLSGSDGSMSFVSLLELLYQEIAK